MQPLFELIVNLKSSSFSVIGMLAIAWFFLALYCFFHCASNSKISNASRGIWLLVIFLIPILGAIGYLIGGKEETKGKDIG